MGLLNGKAAAETPGYGGKTLIAKLGLKPGERLAASTPPDHYPALVAPPPQGAVLHRQGFDRPIAPTDLVHAFFRSTAALKAERTRLAAAPSAALWVSWPKKSSPLFYDLTDQSLRDAILPTGWVDVKVVAVDADWSGLKVLRRRA